MITPNWLFTVLMIILPAPETEDLEFSRAVEESIMAENTILVPEPHNTLIRKLGSPQYKIREQTTKELYVLSSYGPRWLYWGRLNKDPEVRLRCNQILHLIYICRNCSGVGWCNKYCSTGPNLGKNQYDPLPCRICQYNQWMHTTSKPCIRCGGIGSYWVRNYLDEVYFSYIEENWR